MKLVFVTQNEAPFRMRWMDELAKYMEVVIYHLNDYGKAVDSRYISYHTSRAKSVDVTVKRLGYSLYDIIKITNTDYDILLLDGYGFPAQQLLIRHLLRTHTKYGLSIDGGFIPDRENILKRGIKSKIIKNASFIFSTSYETDRFLMYYGAKQECLFRHHFSNIQCGDILDRILSKEDKKRLRLSLGIENIFTFIFCGRLIDSKGLDVLSAAVDVLDEDFQVLIIGGSGDAAESDFKDVHFSKKFKFIPFQDRQSLKRYYQASDVFVMPTRHDAWGLVVSEAMANGLPVITTDKCLAGVDMIENEVNGYIFPVDEVNELAKCMFKIMDKNLDMMAKACIRTVEKYAIERAAKNDISNLNHIAETMKN